MKSGLEDRNNVMARKIPGEFVPLSLNEVRPGRPEQWGGGADASANPVVSMKSGLEDRNNLIDTLPPKGEERLVSQ